jgi:predicted MFS family arabinose efflux permease
VAELSGAAALLIAFLAIEARVKDPMLPLGLFRDGRFTGAQAGAFAISASFFAVFFYTTLYLQQILGLSAIEAGLVYLPGTVIMFFVSGATASVGERVSGRVMVSVGLALVAIGMALLTLAGVDSSWTIALPGSIIAMIGTGLFNPSISNFALGSVPEHQSGLAAGVNDTFRQAGIAVGVAALGALIPTGASLGAADPEAFVGGLRDALWVGAALAAAGAVACWALLRRPAGVPAAEHPREAEPVLEAA